MALVQRNGIAIFAAGDLRGDFSDKWGDFSGKRYGLTLSLRCWNQTWRFDKWLTRGNRWLVHVESDGASSLSSYDQGVPSFFGPEKSLEPVFGAYRIEFVPNC